MSCLSVSVWDCRVNNSKQSQQSELWTGVIGSDVHLARLSGLLCFTMGHNGHEINLYGVVMILMGNLYAGGQSNLGNLSLLHRLHITGWFTQHRIWQLLFSTLLCVSVCLNTPWFWIYWMFYDHLSAHFLLAKLGRWGWLIRMRLAWKKSPKYMYSLKTVAMLSKDMDGNAKRESRSYLGADVCYIRVHDGGRSYIGWYGRLKSNQCCNKTKHLYIKFHTIQEPGLTARYRTHM